MALGHTKSKTLAFAGIGQAAKLALAMAFLELTDGRNMPTEFLLKWLAESLKQIFLFAIIATIRLVLIQTICFLEHRGKILWTWLGSVVTLNTSMLKHIRREKVNTLQN